MCKALKAIIVLVLILNIGVVFAEDQSDWIVFPKDNRNIYPIIFGNIPSPEARIDCNTSFSTNSFYPAANNPYESIDSDCNRSGGNVFFYVTKINSQEIQSIVAKDFFRLYNIRTNINLVNNTTNSNQDINLTFPFKLS
jgi:hypothetical protein